MKWNGPFCKLCECHATGDITTGHRTDGVLIRNHWQIIAQQLEKTGYLTKHANCQTHKRGTELENSRPHPTPGPKPWMKHWHSSTLNYLMISIIIAIMLHHVCQADRQNTWEAISDKSDIFFPLRYEIMYNYLTCCHFILYYSILWQSYRSKV